MSLESATFIQDLVVTNPPGTDLRSQGDDHIRLLKAVMKATFPNATKAFFFPSSSVKTSDYSIVAADMSSVIRVDTSSASVNLTLPALVAGDAGWEVAILKTNTGLNPYFLAPASGTIQSGYIAGLSKTRRCIPGARTRVFWTGSAWIAERVLGAPVGAIVCFAGAALPVGYEWPNGQTLSSAANYPDYNQVRGGLSTPDLRGRLAAGKDDMGGSAAGRLTGSLAGGVSGASFEAVGGAEGHAIGGLQMPPHTHNFSASGSTSGESASHTHSQIASASPGQYTAGGSNGPLGNGSQTGPNSNDHTHNFSISGTTDNGPGTSSQHNNVQPTIIENMLLVVE